MKILWITLESILPANSGGRLGVFKRLEQLSKNNDIYLFYPYDNEQELDRIDELKKYCREVHPYCRKENLFNAFKSLYKYPYTVGSRNFVKMQKDIDLCINNNKIDIINIDFPHMCVNLLRKKYDIPIVLNEHNIEWKVYKLISRSQKNIIKKLVYYLDSIRLRNYEKKILKKIDFKSITFVSSSDLEFFEKYYKPAKKISLELIPVGADIVDNIKVEENKKNKNIIFVGKMSYGPNVEAVKWFVNNVFNKIKLQYPNLKFYIVGKDPTNEVLSLASEDIIVTGIVETTDVYYRNADLVVIPLLNGGGVKVKLLEAISYNKKIVSTSIGVEGTIFSNGETIPVTDNPNEFAKFCIDSLKNDKKIDVMREKAYNIFINNYTWKSIGEKYNKVLKGVIKNYEGKK